MEDQEVTSISPTAGGRPNYLTEAGAKTLASRIVEYWHRRGYEVDAHVVRRGGLPNGWGIWGVQTNLVRGLPRGARHDGMS